MGAPETCRKEKRRHAMRGKLCWGLVTAAVFTFGLAGAAFAQDKATFEGSGKCKICHSKKEAGEQYTKWKAEPHAKAFATLSEDKAKEAAKKKNITKPPAEAPECLKCHATAADAGAEKLAKEEGVQCESCHGPASLHTADGKKYMSDKTVKMDAHIVKPDAKVCVKCHNDQSPTWDPARYTTADGKKTGFDFALAWKKIEHMNPSKKK